MKTTVSILKLPCVQVLSAYLKFMTDIGMLLGGSSGNRSIISERMTEVIKFEQDIAKVRICTFMVCMPLLIL